MKGMYMDALDDLSTSDDDSSDEEDKQKQQASKKVPSISLEALKRCGYKGGPSVMLVPERSNEQQNWTWSSGRNHAKAVKETAEEREMTRNAVTLGTELAVKRGIEQAESIKQLRKAERSAQYQDSKKPRLGEKCKENTKKKVKE